MSRGLRLNNAICGVRLPSLSSAISVARGIEAGGRRVVASGLAIIPPGAPERPPSS